MPKFKVILERVDTITRQAMVIIDAPNAEEARNRVVVNIHSDEAAYDRYLVEVDSGFGRMNVEVKGFSNGTAQVPSAGIAFARPSR